MKKKLRLLCILMVLVLSLGLLSACGGEEPVSLVGNWDCDPSAWWATGTVTTMR